MSRQVLGTVLSGLTMALTLTGCASSDGGGTPGGGTTSRAAASPQDKALKFAQCMRDHGIDMPDPEVGSAGDVQMPAGPNLDRSKLDSAMRACREFAPVGGAGPQQPDPGAQARLRNYAKCMRDNGVPSFPDPDPGTGMIPLDGSIAADPHFEPAKQKCDKDFPLEGGR